MNELFVNVMRKANVQKKVLFPIGESRQDLLGNLNMKKRYQFVLVIVFLMFKVQQFGEFKLFHSRLYPLQNSVICILLSLSFEFISLLHTSMDTQIQSTSYKKVLGQAESSLISIEV